MSTVNLRTRPHPQGAETPERNKQNPTPRSTHTQQLRDIAASARSAFTNLLTTYIATAAHEPTTPSTEPEHSASS